MINTNAGNEKVPAWSLNLKANPEAEVEIGREKRAVVARVAEGEERADLWRRHNEQYSGFDEYETEADREPEVIVLEPRRRPAVSWRRGASAPRAGASAFSACCSRSGGSARG